MAGPSKRMKLSEKELLETLSDSDEFSDSSDFSESENELPEPESCSSSPSASLSDDESDTEPCDTWQTVQGKFKLHRVQFSIADPGPGTNLTNMSTALDFFKLFFTEELPSRVGYKHKRVCTAKKKCSTATEEKLCLEQMERCFS